MDSPLRAEEDRAAAQRVFGSCDQGLFELMVGEWRHSEVARLAFEELYRRHAGQVYGSFQYSALARWYGCEDLLHDTFLRAYERADQFVAEDLAPDVARSRVRGFLRRIGLHLAMDARPRDRGGMVRLVQLTQDCWNELEERGSPCFAGPVDGDIGRIRDALRDLSPRERELLMLHMHWYDPEIEKTFIPTQIAQAICDQFSLSRVNFRQIVSRAIRKLAKRLNADGDA